MTPKATQVLRRGTIYLMAAGCGLAVANNYYSQPILPQMARISLASQAALL